MADWTPELRAHYRDLARRRAPGPVLWADSVVDLIDLLEAAEARAAEADGLRGRLAAAEAVHQPHTIGGLLWCVGCPGKPWPCATAEALAGRSAT